MTYPLPTAASTNSPLSILSYANKITEGWLVNGTLISLYIIVFTIVRAKGYTNSSASVIASMGCFIFGTLFWIGGELKGEFIVMILAINILSFIWSMWDKS